VLAFRAFVAARMHAVLAADAATPHAGRAHGLNIEGARCRGAI
jgi:hypothetical protein